MTKKEINIMESIIDSFVIDKDDRMLNFPSAILTMLKHKISPIELILYIGESIFWATNDEDLKILSSELESYKKAHGLIDFNDMI